MNLSNNQKCAIIIPAKNEECTIGKILDSLLVYFNLGSIVVVVDAASDPTAAIANQKGVRVMYNDKVGKGAAIRFAIANVESDLLVFLDADGSHEINDIPNLIQPILSGEAELVVGSRIKGMSEEFSGGISNTMHYAGNILSAFMINMLWGGGRKIVTDCQNGFRAIRADIAKSLNLEEDSFAIEQEMVIKCIKRGYRIREVVTHEFKREHGNSKINTFKMLPKYISCFIKNL